MMREFATEQNERNVLLFRLVFRLSTKTTIREYVK